MQKQKVLFFLRPIILLVSCYSLLIANSYAQSSQEDITITAYYPSPYGVYRELRSQRKAIGDNYYDGSQYCWPGGTCANYIYSDLDSDGIVDAGEDIVDLVVQGRVGIGTASPTKNLDVRGDFYVVPNGVVAADGLNITNFGGSPAIETTSTALYIRPFGPGNTILNLNAGAVGIGTGVTTYQLNVGGGDINTIAGGYRDAGACVAGTCASDVKLKKNIEFLSNALEKIDQLKPASFEFMDSRFGQGLQYGLIAQDVERVFPDIVKAGEDGMKKVRYGLELQMYMIQAVKELKSENDALKARIEALEAEGK